MRGSKERPAEKPVQQGSKKRPKESRREGQQGRTSDKDSVTGQEDQKKILRIFSLMKEMSRESSVVSMDKIRLSPNVMPFLS